jgi:EAL domain-containing protein (putative c-di-GMP-specific phosphodiesterase class I)
VLTEVSLARRVPHRLFSQIEKTAGRVRVGRLIIIVFQPIVGLGDGIIRVFEALTRFNDGSLPEVRFAEAVPIGLGPELELATLRAALDAAASLPGGGFLSVNVSPALVLEGASLEGLLASADRPLVLEITEHEPIADYAALRGGFNAGARWL